MLLSIASSVPFPQTISFLVPANSTAPGLGYDWNLSNELIFASIIEHLGSGYRLFMDQTAVSVLYGSLRKFSNAS